MAGGWRVAAVVALLSAATACGGSDGTPEATAGPDELERLADVAPRTLLDRVSRAVDAAVIEATVSGSGGAESYVFTASGEAWRADTPASLLAVDGDLCFDRGVRPAVQAAVGPSYGTVEFDRAAWTCTPVEFGLNELLTFRYGREDPRFRIVHLTADDPDSWSAEVEELDGERLLHVRTTGVTADGPLDPARPEYDLWLGADHLPVRLETPGLTWEFAYPEDVADRLAPPPAGERGSYGYTVGPGQGVAKACRQSGTCDEDEFLDPLIWGDGRPAD